MPCVTTHREGHWLLKQQHGGEGKAREHTGGSAGVLAPLSWLSAALGLPSPCRLAFCTRSSLASWAKTSQLLTVSGHSATAHLLPRPTSCRAPGPPPLARPAASTLGPPWVPPFESLPAPTQQPQACPPTVLAQPFELERKG